TELPTRPKITEKYPNFNAEKRFGLRSGRPGGNPPASPRAPRRRCGARRLPAGRYRRPSPAPRLLAQLDAAPQRHAVADPRARDRGHHLYEQQRGGRGGRERGPRRQVQHEVDDQVDEEPGDERGEADRGAVQDGRIDGAEAGEEPAEPEADDERDDGPQRVRRGI